jgi:hypothetical protein
MGFDDQGNEPFLGPLGPLGNPFLAWGPGDDLGLDDFRILWVIGRVDGSLRINQIDLSQVTTAFYSPGNERIDICFNAKSERSCEQLASAASQEEADILMERLFTAIVDGSASVRLTDAPRPRPTPTPARPSKRR